MKQSPTFSQESLVDSQDYTRDYYLQGADGYEFYGSTELCERLDAVWAVAQISQGMRVLDVGCGRAELLVKAARAGAFSIGIDYSMDSMLLTKELLDQSGDLSESVGTAWFCLSNAEQLPFAENTMDRVIFSDVVEHLYPQQLDTALKEAKRVLKPGGAVVIHTMPNLWYYHYGYPLFRLTKALSGKRLPQNPRERFSWSHVHVNEQTPRKLRASLKNAGFLDFSVWLQDYRSYQNDSLRIRRIKKRLTSMALLRNIFCDDIFAFAQKESGV